MFRRKQKYFIGLAGKFFRLKPINPIPTPVVWDTSTEVWNTSTVIWNN